MSEFAQAVERLAKALEGAEVAVRKFVEVAGTEPLAKRVTEWKGTKGQWRRVGGFNLFLREGDGVIMNGPRALQGQPMKNITPDDFRAIPHVKELYEKQGSKAVPGDDIAEVASGVGKVTLTHDKGKAIVHRGFGAVHVKLYAGKKTGSYEKLDEKSFPAPSKSDTAAFEQAKGWARGQLRSPKKARRG